ncbi:unnamed protein product [Allacma fusca]|uniref:Uncharacterized protein n=1 Tax=Allacma fusca TaxID=39272 RepID=A0A8J2JEZ7_9HEXA|nr:unnamed protein product [Allacma fusca]
MSLIRAGSLFHSPTSIFTTLVFTFQLLLLPATEGSFQKRHIQNFSNNKELLFHHSVNTSKHQSDDNSTCTSFSNYDELYSKCMSFVNREKLNVLRNSMNSSLSGEFWCSCENHPCSLIYKVENGSKIKNVFLTGFLDNKAEIVILAEYTSDKGEFFQIGKLHGYHEYTVGLKRIKFDYLHEGYLDVSTLNVTMILNGGFSLIEDFVVILDEDKQGLEQTPSTPAQPPEVVTLDHEEDSSKREWIEVTCHYGNYFEDFWAFGCPANADANFMPSTTGYWFPCHEKTCSFTYDGTSHPKPTSVTIDGYLQGGTIEISGKNDILDGTPWKTLSLKEFHNTTVYQMQFDLHRNCDMKVLQITLTGDKDNIIIIDKITIQPDIGAGSQCAITMDEIASTTGKVHEETSYEMHSDAWNFKALNVFPFLLTISFLFIM